MNRESKIADKVARGWGPYEQPYPEGVFQEVNIRLVFDPATKRYQIHCPEWRYEGAGGASPAHSVASLVNEIVRQNSEALKG